MSKKSKSKSGSLKQSLKQNLISNISVAKGLLATLSLGHPSLWTNKYQKTPKEHLRILLQEVMEEICTAENLLHQMK